MIEKAKKIILWTSLSTCIVVAVGTTVGIVLRDEFNKLNKSFQYTKENLIFKYQGDTNKTSLFFQIPSEMNNEDIQLEDFQVFNDKNENLTINYNESLADKINNSIILMIDEAHTHTQSKSYIVKSKKFADFEIKINNVKTFVYENQAQQLNYFKDYLKDMAINNIPSIVQTRAASLVIQQDFYISLVNYYNQGSTDDQVILTFGQTTIDNNRFDQQTLIDQNIWNGVHEIDKINDINEKQYLIWDENVLNLNDALIQTNDWLDFYNKIIKKFNYQDKKIDFVFEDLSFTSMIDEFASSSDIKNTKLYFVLKHANRILLPTDGNAHTNSVIPKLYTWMSNIKIKTREENIKTLSDFQNGTNENLSTNDVLNLLLLKNYESSKGESKFNFIDFLNFDSNIHNSLNLDDERFWNETNFSANFVDYQELVDNPNEYLSTYSKLFMSSNLTMESLFVNGLEEYDPNKRNAIFIGSSLFIPLGGTSSMTPENFSRLQIFPNLRKVVQEEMKQFLEKYPPSEYNIIFKLHPAFSQTFDTKNQIAINYVNLITDGIITNPIILSSSIPLETLLANDYYIFSQGQNNSSNIKNFIFRENDKYKAQEWSVFFGLQASTTTIMTTRIFYQNTFNLTKYESAKVVPFSNFGIPKKFQMIKRENEDINDSTDYYKDNVEAIIKLYSPYNPSLFYQTKLLEYYDSIILDF